jgi:hypothetical protein
MLNLFTGRIFVVLGATDMRKSFDTLFGVVRYRLGTEPTDRVSAATHSGRDPGERGRGSCNDRVVKGSARRSSLSRSLERPRAPSGRQLDLLCVREVRRRDATDRVTVPGLEVPGLARQRGDRRAARPRDRCEVR